MAALQAPLRWICFFLRVFLKYLKHIIAVLTGPNKTQSDEERAHTINRLGLYMGVTQVIVRSYSIQYFVKSDLDCWISTVAYRLMVIVCATEIVSGAFLISGIIMQKAWQIIPTLIVSPASIIVSLLCALAPFTYLEKGQTIAGVIMAGYTLLPASHLYVMYKYEIVLPYGDTPFELPFITVLRKETGYDALDEEPVTCVVATDSETAPPQTSVC